MRAGRLVLGTKAVRDAARRGTLSGALIAADVTVNGQGRVLPLLAASGVRAAQCGTVRQLGQAVGRERLAIVGIADEAFADRIMAGLPVLMLARSENR